MPAEIWPDEGLDLALNVFPMNTLSLNTTYLALFTAFTATTVGASTSVADNYVEPNFAAYARQVIIASSWTPISAGTGGRKVPAAQVTFPTATGNSTSATNGFWLANQLSATSDKTIFAANFDDDTAVTINTNDVIKVTPTIQYNN